MPERHSPSVSRGPVQVALAVTILLYALPATALVGQGDSAIGTLDSRPPVVAIDYPVGGEFFDAAEQETLRWSVDEDLLDTEPPPIVVAVEDDGGEIWSEVVLPDAQGQYVHVWTVTDVHTSTARLRVVATDHFGAAGEATSPLFTIRNSLSPVPPGRLPIANRLEPNHPNPFNPLTTLHFALSEPASVELAIFDLSGRRVALLAADRRGAGEHSLVWRGVDDAGRSAASGTYLARLSIHGESGRRTLVRRMTLLK